MTNRLTKLLLMLLAFSVTAHSKAAVIDTAIITTNASGSLNSIAGTCNIDSLFKISENASFNYFTVELTGFVTNPDYLGLAQSLTLSFWDSSLTNGAGLYWNLNTGIYLGKTFTVSSSEYSSVYDHMLNLISGSSNPVPLIRTGMSWSFGGIDGSATASFLVTAHGDIAPVPLPASIWFFGAGLLGIFSFQKRRA